MGLLDVGNYLTDPQNSANLGIIQGLLQASAPSRLPISTTQAIGMGMQGANMGRMQSLHMQQEAEQLKAAQFANQMMGIQLPYYQQELGGIMNGQSPGQPAMPQQDVQQPHYDNGVNQIDTSAPYMAAPNPAISAQPYQNGNIQPTTPGYTPVSQPTNGLLTPQSQPSVGLASGFLGSPNADALYSKGRQHLLIPQLAELGKSEMQAALAMSPYAHDPTALAAMAGGHMPGSPEFQRIVQAGITKATNIPPVSLRGQAYATTDPMTGKVVVNTLPDPAPAGYMNHLDPVTGQWSVAPVQGGPQAVQQSAYSSAAGSKGYAPAPASQPTAPDAAGGSRFVGYGGNQQTNAPVYGPGSDAAINTMATDNAKRASATTQAAVGSNERVNVLDNILQLSAAGTDSGPTAEWKNHIKGIVASTPLLSSAFPDWKDDVSHYQELQKFTYQNGLRAWQAAGGTGTDAQMESFSHANPNTKLFPQALQEIARWSKAGEIASQAKANAQDDWLARNGNNPQAQNKFEATWRNNFEPKIYQLQVMNPAQRLEFMQKTFPTLYPKPGQNVKPDPVQQRAYDDMVRKEQFARQNGWVQ